jgi:hypothetical protein
LKIDFQENVKFEGFHSGGANVLEIQGLFKPPTQHHQFTILMLYDEQNFVIKLNNFCSENMLKGNHRTIMLHYHAFHYILHVKRRHIRIAWS